jgi:hypothetical protein
MSWFRNQRIEGFPGVCILVLVLMPTHRSAQHAYPNIVSITIYSVPESDGLHFLTMQFVEGQPRRLGTANDNTQPCSSAYRRPTPRATRHVLGVFNSLRVEAIPSSARQL